ncbi:hydantoinase B/oxoprolinase family protein [Halorubraceae archaeon YAN]|nr:hydantoinase B/oxoprolinase family protein [Halorubraceae archaeon YAN]
MTREIDPITLEIIRNQLEGIAEEMGSVLIRSAYSPNIKERQDCSTALFDHTTAKPRMIAQAEHIPVHLGAMPAAVAAVVAKDPHPGDVWVLNDPFTGGTHLPDVTMVSPIAPDGEIIGYGVSRAHHGDIGGMTPGSMPAGAREIYQEGLRLPPVPIVTGGEINQHVLSILLANVRNTTERRADIQAQIAANTRAADRLKELQAEYGSELLPDAFDAVIDYSETRMRSEIASLPDGTYHATDYLEGDGITTDNITIAAAVTVQGETLAVDFSGTDAQVAGNTNAPRAVTESAVYFVVRAVTNPDIPPNEGCYAPIDISVPTGSLLDPTAPAAVVGGNVETSQRVTDVVLSAFAEALPESIPAQSQGTMNNLIIGSRESSGFTYYETIGGGFGGRPTADGLDGVQVGMTNTKNTPIEAVEVAYPMRVERYCLRPNSGGAGRYRGGMGIERSITISVPATVSVLSERRVIAPRGVAGGRDGAVGENLLGNELAPGKFTREVPAETTVTIRTPGGGGYGDPKARDPDAAAADWLDKLVTTDKDT